MSLRVETENRHGNGENVSESVSARPYQVWGKKGV